VLTEELQKVLLHIQHITNNSPDLIPTDETLAKQYGFSSLQSFRKYCLANLPPKDFLKIGKKWYIRFSALLLHFEKDNKWQKSL
jgi:hypothetical protein